MIWNRITRALSREWKAYTKKGRWYAGDVSYKIAPERKKLLLRKGFVPSSDFIFNFNEFGFEAFLNDRDYLRLHPINHPIVSQIIDSKGYLPLILADRKEWLPDFFAFSSKGQILYQRRLISQATNSKKCIKDALHEFKKLIVKPLSFGGGKGIFTLTEDNFNEHIEAILKKDFVLNNVLENELFLSNIYPESLNTIRVVFFKNQTGRNELLMLAQRFGTSLSKSVDNVSSGGMAASIDPLTGKLSRAYTLDNKSSEWHSVHYDSKKQIEGLTIPNWQEKLVAIQEIIDYLDFVEFAGLDLAFTNRGIKIIEINSLPQGKLMQVGGPALLNSNFKSFIEHKGYFPKG